jgi:hypothetical protein
MHLFLRHVSLLLLIVSSEFAADLHTTRPVTIVLDFRGPYSHRSLQEMKQEVQGLVKDAGVRLEWKTRNDAIGDDNGDLIVVRFNGKCIMEPVGYLYDERGVLAYTHTVYGNVLPFSEVSCNQVTASLRSAMFGGDYAEADRLLGRALGRVVTHELVHVLANTREHAHEGVYKEALSGKQLIKGSLTLSESDVKRIQSDRRR